MFRYFYWLKKAKILIKKIHFCSVKCKIWWWNVCKTYWCTTLWPDYLWPLYKSGFIFQGLNVSCETSVNCHMWLLSLCLCDFALCIKTCEFSRDSEIKSDPNTLTLCFLLSLFREACICAHMWLAFVICIYIYMRRRHERRDTEGWEEKRALMDVCEKTSKLAIMSAVNALQDQIGGIFSWSGSFTTREGEKNR